MAELGLELGLGRRLQRHLPGLKRILIAVFLFGLPLVISPLNTSYQYTKTIFALVFISLLLLVWAVEILGSRRYRYRVHLTPLFVPALALLAVSLLSMINSSNLKISLASLVMLVYYFLFYLLLANAVETERDVKLFLGSIFASAAVASLYGLIQFYGYELVPRPHPIAGGRGYLIATMGNRNYLVGFTSYLFLPSALLLVWLRRGWLKGLVLLGLLIIYTVIVISHTVGVWLGLFIATLFLAGVVLHPRFRAKLLPPLKREWRWIAALGGAMALITLLYLFPNPFHEVLNRGKATLFEEAASTLGALSGPYIRYYDWGVSWEMIKDHPILGQGLGNFKLKWLYYKDDFLKTPLGKPFAYQEIAKANQAHNEYVQIWTELGILGLLVSGWLIWLTFRRGFGELGSAVAPAGVGVRPGAGATAGSGTGTRAGAGAEPGPKEVKDSKGSNPKARSRGKKKEKKKKKEGKPKLEPKPKLKSKPKPKEEVPAQLRLALAIPALLAGVVALLAHAVWSFPLHLPASALDLVLFLGILNSRYLQRRCRRQRSLPGAEAKTEKGLAGEGGSRSRWRWKWSKLAEWLKFKLGLQPRARAKAKAGVGAKAKLALGGLLVALALVVTVLAVRDFIGDIHARRGRGLLLYLDKPEIAKEYLLRSIQLKFQPTEEWFYLGVAYSKLGEVDRAKEAFFKAREAFADPFIYANLGALEASEGNYEKALEYLDQAARMAPNNRHILNQKLNVLRRLGQTAEAIAVLERLARAHRDEKAYIELGNAFLSQEDWAKAAHSYRQALEIIEGEIADLTARYEQGKLSPEEYQAQLARKDELRLQLYRNLAGSEANRGDYEQALEYYDRALELAPEEEALELLWAKARIQQRLGDLEGAIATLERIIEIKPDERAYLMLGNIYIDREDWAKAARATEEALAIIEGKLEELRSAYEGGEIEEEEYRRRLRGLEGVRGQLYKNLAGMEAKQGHYEQALTYYEEALRARPADLEILYAQAEVYRRLGQLEGAIATLERVIEIDPDELKAYMELGELHREQGELEAAVESYKKALTLVEQELAELNSARERGQLAEEEYQARLDQMSELKERLLAALEELKLELELELEGEGASTGEGEGG